MSELADLAGGVRQNATGLLGTTLQLSDLVSQLPHCGGAIIWSRYTMLTCHLATLSQVIPFVAGGFLYIGAVAVLPT